MKAFVDKLHSNGQHWIAITDAGVAADEGYTAYEEGERDGVFIKANTGDSYLGQVRRLRCLVGVQ
jgi:alpha-glucosidase (family GH31 glycosyl hydrolase)